MSTIGSSLSKGQDGTPLINPSALGQLAGVPKDMSRAAFDAAVTQERANITNNGTGVWNGGEKISIFGEVGTRIWFVGASASLSHARNVTYQGQVYALAGDANVFGPTTGAPASGTGANGDYLADATAGLVYGPKASGTWPAGVMALSIPGQDPTTVQGITAAAGTEPILFFDPTSKLFHSMTPTVLQTWLAAHDGRTNLQALTPLTSPPSDLVLFGASGGAPVTIVWANMVGTSSSGGSTTPTPTPTTTPTPTPTTTPTPTPTSTNTALTMTNPTYAFRTGTSGAKMLTAGSGSGTVTLPKNAFVIKAQVKMQAGGASDNSAAQLLSIADANGNSVGIGFLYTSICAFSMIGGGGGRGDPSGNYADGAVHEVALVVENGFCHAYVDSTQTAERFLAYTDFNPSAGACTITVGCGAAGQGEYDIRAYSGSLSALGPLIAEWQLDSSGAKS